MKKSILLLLVLLLFSGCSNSSNVLSTEQNNITPVNVENSSEDPAQSINTPKTIAFEESTIQNAVYLNSLMREVTQSVQKTTVSVTTQNSLGITIQSGSGVVYKYENGKYFALTNDHVITGASSIRVYFDSDTYEEATLVGTDSLQDVAIISFSTDYRGLQIAMIGDTNQMQVGEFVITVGTPSNLVFFNTTTFGIVSGVERYLGVSDSDGDGQKDVFRKMIQHDAAISPGNSGGPLFNLSGEVIGINTIKITSENVDNIGFAIPMDLAMRVAEDVEKYGEVKYAKIGIRVGDLKYMQNIDTHLSAGCYVSEVSVNGPAATTSNLQSGDIITMFNGFTINRLYELKDKLFLAHPGDEVSIGFYRGETYMETQIVLGEV